MRMLDLATYLERTSKRLLEQPTGFNLSQEQHKLMKLLQSDDRFIVCQTDKNLGPEILESDAYIKLTLKDHQSDRSTYQLLSREESATILITTRRRFQHRNSLSSAEKTYFERSMKLGQHNHHHWYTLRQLPRTLTGLSNQSMWAYIDGDWMPWVRNSLVRCSSTVQNSHRPLEPIDLGLCHLLLNTSEYVRDSLIQDVPRALAGGRKIRSTLAYAICS